MPHFLKSLFSPIFLHDLGVLKECITLRSWLSPVWVCVCVHMYNTFLDVMYLYSCTIHTYVMCLCLYAPYITCAHTCTPKCIRMHPYVPLLHFLNPNNSSFLPHRKKITSMKSWKINIIISEASQITFYVSIKLLNAFLFLSRWGIKLLHSS